MRKTKRLGSLIPSLFYMSYSLYIRDLNFNYLFNLVFFKEIINAVNRI